MKDEKQGQGGQVPATGGSIPNRILGTLRDALAAASRDHTGEITVGERTEILPREDRAAVSPAPEPPSASSPPPPVTAAAPPSPPPPAQSAADAVREAKKPVRVEIETGEPTTRVVRGVEAAMQRAADAGRTQVVRGKPRVTRGNFEQDPVVGWLVVVGGPGLGAFRSIYEGNNTVGRSPTQRIPIDFGDNTISSEEQAYIRYDSMDRSFLFVPNLSKTNVVAVNNKKPTAAIKLEHMDLITMGRTQLAFVPFCGEEFDWSELSEVKE